jgi:hypothetical protein
MVKTACWAAAVAISITAIAWSSAQFSIEDVKQRAFMMKVCTDAGGSWVSNWRNEWSCEQPNRKD